MPHVEEMSPLLIQKLLEGRRDEVTGPLAEQEAFYADASCPQCAADCRKSGRAPGGDLPRFLLECLGCGCEFNPHTGFIVKMGNVAEAVEPAVPLIDP